MTRPTRFYEVPTYEEVGPLSPAIVSALRSAIGVYHALTLDKPIEHLYEVFEVEGRKFTITIKDITEVTE